MRFALFEVVATMDHDCLNIHLTYPRNSNHQHRIRSWMQSYQEALVLLTSQLDGPRKGMAIADIPNGSKSPNGFASSNGSKSPNGFTPTNGSKSPNGFTPTNGSKPPNGFAPPNGSKSPNGFAPTNGFKSTNGFTSPNGSKPTNGSKSHENGLAVSRAKALLTERELEMIWSWNAKVPEPVDKTLHSQVEQQAAVQPEAPAISAWDGELSYGELDKLATRLAIRLTSLGVGPEVIVPLCFEKSKWVAVAVLAVLKAGGAFTLLDPSQPIARLRNVVKQTEARIMLCSFNERGNGPARTQLRLRLRSTPTGSPVSRVRRSPSRQPRPAQQTVPMWFSHRAAQALPKALLSLMEPSRLL